ncbi:hypothetical protein HDV57DRAFT_18839 [Trichoderma longibrachiatum]
MSCHDDGPRLNPRRPPWLPRNGTRHPAAIPSDLKPCILELELELELELMARCSHTPPPPSICQGGRRFLPQSRIGPGAQTENDSQTRIDHDDTTHSGVAAASLCIHGQSSPVFETLQRPAVVHERIRPDKSTPGTGYGALRAALGVASWALGFPGSGPGPLGR